MKKVFLCSLCHKGILGGALILDEQALTYQTGKTSIDLAYKNLKLPFSEIQSVTWKWRLFPLAIFEMQDGRFYRFLIFNMRRFCRCFSLQTGIKQKKDHGGACL